MQLASPLCYPTEQGLDPIAGRLDEALEKYKQSKKYGVERAAVHIRNVSLFICHLTTHLQLTN